MKIKKGDKVLVRNLTLRPISYTVNKFLAKNGRILFKHNGEKFSFPLDSVLSIFNLPVHDAKSAQVCITVMSQADVDSVFYYVCREEHGDTMFVRFSYGKNEILFPRDNIKMKVIE